MAITETTESIKGPVGKNMPRVDVHEKVTGAAVYTDDIQFGNSLLFARIKRSPLPHALIKSIDTSKAEAFPGVKVVVTGADFPKADWSLSQG
jgi:CO/xanthine dehydrogenase Mo-binding subunit